MATMVNDRDKKLRDSEYRTVNVEDARVFVTASAPGFRLNTHGVNLGPTAIIFTAGSLFLDGALTFTFVGCTPTVVGNVATMVYEDMQADTAEVSVSIVQNGTLFINTCSVRKHRDMTPNELAEAVTGLISEDQLTNTLGSRIDLVDADGTGLVDRVDALVLTYGETSSAAQSAAEAAESASDAVAAEAAARLAAGDSVGAAVASNEAKLAAQAANQAAGTSAGAAFNSAQTAAGYADDAEAGATASNSAKLAAESAKGSAESAASAASTARDTATAKSAEASGHATAASTSANTASTKAGEAAAHATSAATSESNAAGSANSASTSATNSATSRDQASGFSTAASGHASTAGTKADNASNSATAANSARVAAESARDAAGGHAQAASTSASTASTRADDAGSYANSASGYASTAYTSAGQALAYRDSAAQSATNAQGYANASAQDYSAINARLNNVGGTGVSVETKMSAVADSVTGLSGQIVNKIDINGYVTGYGLASTASTAGPTSAFVVLADAFKVVMPGYGAVRMFYVDADGAYMDKAFIRELEVSKITSGTINAEWRITGAGGRIVLDNGSVMKVIGTGFGANGDLIEWFGPKMSISDCTKANATAYLGTDGSAYFGGALRAGTLYNAQRTTQTAANAEVPVGPFSSNGGVKTVVVSYSFSHIIRSNTITGATGFTRTGGSTYADIQLLRSLNGSAPVVVASTRINGSYGLSNESEAPDIANTSMGGSMTYTDNGGAGNYTFTARIVARSEDTFSHPDSQNHQYTQSLGIVSTEV